MLITEDIADAITAHEAGHAPLSPETTSFQHEVCERLLTLLEQQAVGTVFVVQNAELPATHIMEEYIVCER